MYYQKHVFVCTNQREDGKVCCANHRAMEACHYLKKQIKQRGLAGRNGIRVSQSGCLGRCEEGPVMVVYPAGNWYTYQSQRDWDKIIEKDLLDNEKAEDLALSD